MSYTDDKKRWGKWADFRRSGFPYTDDDSIFPCRTCGRPTIMKHDPQCINCWEVEHRLDSYLRDGTETAASVLRAALEKAGL